MAFDPLGAGLATLAAALVGAAFLFTWRYFETPGPDLPRLSCSSSWAGWPGSPSPGDLFNLFVFFELMSVSRLRAHRLPHRGAGARSRAR